MGLYWWKRFQVLLFCLCGKEVGDGAFLGLGI